MTKTIIGIYVIICKSMTNDKEIYVLPFWNFTLGEFSQWRKSLEVAKTLDCSMNLDETIKIVYYHLAIGNYRTACVFLDFCDKHDNRIKMLRMLLTSDRKAQVYCFISREILETLFELCIKKYHPALLWLGTRACVSVLDIYCDNVTEIQYKLNIIVIIMNEMHIDKYYVDRVQGLLDTKYDESLKYIRVISRIQPDYNIMQQHLKNILGGSVAALLRILSLVYSNTNELCYYNVLFEHSNLKGPLDSLDQTHKDVVKEFGSTVSNIAMALITKFDHDFIINLLTFFDRCKEDHLKRCIIDLLPILKRCTETCYEYLVLHEQNGDFDSCNVGILIAYLKVVSNGLVECDETLSIKCASWILHCHKAGFMFLPNPSEVFKTTFKPIYKKWPISKEYQFTDACLSIINDLVENNFGWIGTQDGPMSKLCLNLDDYDGPKCFIFLLEQSPKLWIPALSALGLNLFKQSICENPKKLHQSLMLLYPNKKADIPVSDTSTYLTNFRTIIDNVLLRLDQVKEEYSNIFGESIDEVEANILISRGLDIKQKIITGFCHETKSTTNTFDTLCYLFDMYRFYSRYSDFLISHKKYQPGGEGYLLSLNNFNVTLFSTIMNG